MEIMMRCALRDRPGALAALAGAISDAGGDIQAVDVVETAGGRALDDLVVVVERAQVAALVRRVQSLDDVKLVHAGPSRGHPGDAVARLALGLESLLNGAMTFEHGLSALIGGLLRASNARLCPTDDAPPGDDTTLVLSFGHRSLVVRRDYRFTDTERARAESILRVCLATARAAQPRSSSRVG